MLEWVRTRVWPGGVESQECCGPSRGIVGVRLGAPSHSCGHLACPHPGVQSLHSGVSFPSPRWGRVEKGAPLACRGSASLMGTEAGHKVTNRAQKWTLPHKESHGELWAEMPPWIAKGWVWAGRLGALMKPKEGGSWTDGSAICPVFSRPTRDWQPAASAASPSWVGGVRQATSGGFRKGRGLPEGEQPVGGLRALPPGREVEASDDSTPGAGCDTLGALRTPTA